MTQAGATALPLALAGLAAAALLAFLLTPVAARFATWAGAIDLPGAARRIHARPIPRGGGLAVLAAFVAVGLGLLYYDGVFGTLPTYDRLGRNELIALFAGSGLAAALGFLDDRFELRARWQFVEQLFLAAVVVASGATITFINNPFGGGVMHFTGVWAAAITAVWVVGMINSINFIDGLDGLSSGVSMIAAITLGVIALTEAPAEPVIGLLCFALAGALAGFLPWNFHPARIFVGTTGVFLLGYALALLSIVGTAKVAVALLVLGVPIIDTFWIIVRRVSHGSSPFTPDRGHLHHRLLDLGLGHRQAVLLIYLICTTLAVLSLVLSGTGQLYAFLGIVVGFGILLYLLTRRAQEALEASTYDLPEPETSTREALVRSADDRDL